MNPRSSRWASWGIDPALSARLEALLAADDRGESFQHLFGSEPARRETPARIGAYDVIGVLGVGGMGEVYRARDGRLPREVAIKVLPAAVVDDPERLARFEREARVLASLNHPNIAQVYGLDESGGTPALVMELVPGPTLADVIAGDPGAFLPPLRALAISGSEGSPRTGLATGATSCTSEAAARSRGATCGWRPLPRLARRARCSTPRSSKHTAASPRTASGSRTPRTKRGSSRSTSIGSPVEGRSAWSRRRGAAGRAGPVTEPSSTTSRPTISSWPSRSGGSGIDSTSACPRPLFAIHPRPPVRLDAYPYDVSPDARRFVVNTLTDDTTSTAITLVLDWRAGLPDP